jgi:transposase
MNQYVGLDVSLEETKIHVLDEAGGRVWRGKCASHPDELETTICKHAPGAVRRAEGRSAAVARGNGLSRA